MRPRFRAYRSPRTRGLLLFLLVVLLIGGRAVAASHRVELALEGPGEHREQTRLAVEEAVRELDVALVNTEQIPTAAQAVGGQGGPSVALARVRVALLPDHLQLVIVDRAGTGVYVRTVPLDPSGEALAYEQLTQILRSTIAAMKEQELAADREGASPPGEPPLSLARSVPTRAQDLSRPGWGGDLGAAITGTIYAPELLLLPGVEAQGGAWWGRGAHRAVARLSVGYRRAGVRSDELSLTVHQIPIYAVVGHRLQAGDFRLESLAGAGVVLVEPQTRARASDLEVSDRPHLIAGSFRLELRLERQLSAGFHVFSAVRADFDVSRTRLVVDDDGIHDALVSPFFVAPSLALGVSLGR